MQFRNSVLAANDLDWLATCSPDLVSLKADLYQAEDTFPLGSSSLPDPQFLRSNSAGKKKEEPCIDRFSLKKQFGRR